MSPTRIPLSQFEQSQAEPSIAFGREHSRFQYGFGSAPATPSRFCSLHPSTKKTARQNSVSRARPASGPDQKHSGERADNFARKRRNATPDVSSNLISLPSQLLPSHKLHWQRMIERIAIRSKAVAVRSLGSGFAGAVSAALWAGYYGGEKEPFRRP